MNVVKKHVHGEVTGWELGYAPVGRPLMNTIFYLVDGILVDTAQRHMRRVFGDIVKEAKVEQVVLTHHHEDHCGNAATVKRITGARVFGHSITGEKLRSGFGIRPYQKIVWGKADTVEIEPLPDYIQGGRIRLVPVHTPGHSKDHSVFHEPERGWLFSGDLYLGSRIKYFRADEVFHDTVRSIEKVLTLDFDTLFCAHNPRWSGGKKHLADKLGFLKEFSGEASRLHGEGRGVEEIVSAMRLDRQLWVRIFTTGNVSIQNMVRSAIAEFGRNSP